MFNLSQLYSMRDRNAAEIHDLEEHNRDLKLHIQSYVNPNNTPKIPLFAMGNVRYSRKLIRENKAQIAKLAAIQKNIKQEIARKVDAEWLARLTEKAKQQAPVQATTTTWTDKGIGDVNSSAKGSGARYNSGKPDYSMIPLFTLEDETRVWMAGAAKYSAWNWTKGMAWSVPFASLMRHLAKWQIGQENDEETGLPHLDHAMCNLRMLKLYSTNYKEGDDRPKHIFN